MDRETPRTDGASLGVLDKTDTEGASTRPEGRGGARQALGREGASAEDIVSFGSARRTSVRSRKRRLTSPLFMVGYFAVLNVIMYLTIHKFWIGGSSFLPMVGKFGEGNKFLFAFLVNVGVIIGAFVGAYSSGEFRLRLPKKRDLAKAIIGGTLIGMGVTVAPGTCTTAFVTGMPMLSVSSFLSAAGIFIGAQIVYSHTLGRR